MRLLLLAGVIALFCAPGSASGQTNDENGEAYDIECPGGLNAYFRGDYEAVDHAGKEWLSQWFAFSPDRPLPSRTWYYAYPDRHITSTDNTSVWEWAEIKVHCWVYRRLYVMVVHYDPIDFGGYVKAIPSDPVDGGGCGGGEHVTSVSPAGSLAGGSDPAYEPSREFYDPYDPGCGGSGGGGTGGSGEGGGASGEDEGGGTTFPEQCSSFGGRLYYDYICLEQWNEETGAYEAVWCGTAAICET
jgi:hypothetical protein